MAYKKLELSGEEYLDLAVILQLYIAEIEMLYSGELDKYPTAKSTVHNAKELLRRLRR